MPDSPKMQDDELDVGLSMSGMCLSMSMPDAKAELTGSGGSSVTISSESESEELARFIHDDIRAQLGRHIPGSSSSSSSPPTISGKRPREERGARGVRGRACGWDVRRRWRRASDRISCSRGEDSEISVARRGAGSGRPVNGGAWREVGRVDPPELKASLILALPLRRLDDGR